MIQTTYEVRLMSAESLVPAPYNPRIRLPESSAAYRKLRQSLQDFGLVEPLIWNETTGHLVGGHARYRILREMGIAQIPVTVVHLSPEREKALNIVLNNQEAQGRYDVSKLSTILTELSELPEMSMTGFDATTLRQLKLEPIVKRDTPIPHEQQQELLTLVLEMSPAIFAHIQPLIDQMIHDYDIRSHVKQVGKSFNAGENNLSS